ncbi:response regulator [Paraferrimonas sedimenticola]|uniref:DNA-binding response regulator n=1 Tax=Paraferrimonas sedimenticola TaxID=375674 RepID=A0AA37W124_9GAMM|nr:response regulator [Paraferrimonas sedimenticola]GLP95772.1 DNA-binding response regulator [Paraferrimonas sedimenticola]
MSLSYSVLVVDDHPLLRKGICQLIEAEDEFELFGEVGSGLDALASMRDDEPDLVVLDLNMKGMSGLDTLNAIRADGITSKVAILTVSDNKQDVLRLMRAGADGYLLKDSDPDDLIDSLKQVMLGKQVLSEQVSAYLTEQGQGKGEPNWIMSLTPRELQILQLVAEGMSNRLISENLHISEGTVKVHIKNLLRKADAKSRTEMAVRFLNQ